MLEAIACGCKVISTTGTGGDEISGVRTYKAGDIESLANQIRKVVEENGISPLLPSRYTVKGMTSRLLNHYSSHYE